MVLSQRQKDSGLSSVTSITDDRRLEGQPDTCEVSETISRMLLAVNSFLPLSKDNARAAQRED